MAQNVTDIQPMGNTTLQCTRERGNEQRLNRDCRGQSKTECLTSKGNSIEIMGRVMVTMRDGNCERKTKANTAAPLVVREIHL
jgi:hypothetical protein